MDILNKPSALFERFLPSTFRHFSAGENVNPRIPKNENVMIYESNKVFFTFEKIYLLLYLQFLHSFFLSWTGKNETLFSRGRIVGGECIKSLNNEK
jgi:hypothetical protein